MSSFLPVASSPSLRDVAIDQRKQFHLPPRVNSSCVQKTLKRSRNNEDSETGVKSQYLNRIDKYINPPNSNAINSAFDINFMMRDNAKELSSSHCGTSQRQPSQGAYVGINAPKRLS